MESSANKMMRNNIIAATTSPPMMLCLSSLIIFVFLYKLLLPKIIPHPITSGYLIPAAANLKWAWSFLLRYSLFPNHTMNVAAPETGGLRRYRRPEAAGAKEEEGAECAVCLCKIEEGEEIRELRCSHVFHRECLDRWAGTCPLCRRPLAPPTMADQVGVEVIVFNFYSFVTSSPTDHRSAWWLRELNFHANNV